MQYSKTSGSIWDVNKPIPDVHYGWGDLPLEVTFLTLPLTRAHNQCVLFHALTAAKGIKILFRNTRRNIT